MTICCQGHLQTQVHRPTLQFWRGKPTAQVTTIAPSKHNLPFHPTANSAESLTRKSSSPHWCPDLSKLRILNLTKMKENIITLLPLLVFQSGRLWRATKKKKNKNKQPPQSPCTDPHTYTKTHRLPCHTFPDLDGPNSSLFLKESGTSALAFRTYRTHFHSYTGQHEGFLCSRKQIMPSPPSTPQIRLEQDASLLCYDDTTQQCVKPQPAVQWQCMLTAEVLVPSALVRALKPVLNGPVENIRKNPQLL